MSYKIVFLLWMKDNLPVTVSDMSKKKTVSVAHINHYITHIFVIFTSNIVWFIITNIVWLILNNTFLCVNYLIPSPHHINIHIC